MDAAQILLLAVVVVLTILFAVLGIQVFFILREFRQTVAKANRVLEETSSIAQNISRPFSSLGTLATGVKTGTMLAKLFKNRKKLLSVFINGDEDEG